MQRHEALEMMAVSSHTSEALEGRTRVELLSADAKELRPEIFAMARDRGWTLWELHREKANLEQLFRNLTASGVYTTSQGMNDLGYIGNVALPRFDGPPPEVLEHLGLD